MQEVRQRIKVTQRKAYRFLIPVLIPILIMVLNVQRAQAATPRVMLSDYSIEEGEIVAGQPFTLHITLKNTAANSIRNLKLTISTEKGEFLPVDGAGTAYLEKLAGRSESEFTFAMQAVDGLTTQSYKLLLKSEYEGNDGSPYTVEESIFLPITLQQRCSVTDVFLPDSDVELGETVEIGASVNNLGEEPLYNVTAGISGSNVAVADTYIGTIDAGKRGNVDLLTKASAISSGDKNELTVSYEDRKGERHTVVQSIELKVAQPVYENLEKVKDDTHTGQGWMITSIVLGVLMITGGVVGLILQRRRRKKKLLEEF